MIVDMDEVFDVFVGWKFDLNFADVDRVVIARDDGIDVKRECPLTLPLPSHHRHHSVCMPSGSDVLKRHDLHKLVWSTHFKAPILLRSHRLIFALVDSCALFASVHIKQQLVTTTSRRHLAITENCVITIKTRRRVHGVLEVTWLADRNQSARSDCEYTKLLCSISLVLIGVGEDSQRMLDLSLVKLALEWDERDFSSQWQFAGVDARLEVVRVETFEAPRFVVETHKYKMDIARVNEGEQCESRSQQMCIFDVRMRQRVHTCLWCEDTEIHRALKNVYILRSNLTHMSLAFNKSKI